MNDGLRPFPAQNEFLSEAGPNGSIGSVTSVAFSTVPVVTKMAQPWLTMPYWRGFSKGAMPVNGNNTAVFMYDISKETNYTAATMPTAPVDQSAMASDTNKAVMAGAFYFSTHYNYAQKIVWDTSIGSSVASANLSQVNANGFATSNREMMFINGGNYWDRIEKITWQTMVSSVVPSAKSGIPQSVLGAIFDNINSVYYGGVWGDGKNNNAHIDDIQCVPSRIPWATMVSVLSPITTLTTKRVYCSYFSDHENVGYAVAGTTARNFSTSVTTADKTLFSTLVTCACPSANSMVAAMQNTNMADLDEGVAVQPLTGSANTKVKFTLGISRALVSAMTGISQNVSATNTGR